MESLPGVETDLVFEAAGLTSDEEQLYQLLVEEGGLTAAQIAKSSRLQPRVVRRVLDSLENKGLVSRAPDRSPIYYPAPPDVAIEVLILRRQEELERARVAASQLMKRFRTSVQRVDPLEMIEVVTGRDAIRQRFRQLQQAAKGEVAAFDRPPYISPSPTNAPTESESLHRGVRYRVVYEASVLDEGDFLRALETYMDAGEEARTFSGLPMKLDIFDGRTALMPLNLEEPGTAGALVVHAPSLVTALSMLFETVWERAAPVKIGAATRDSSIDGDGLFDPEERRILALLAAGLKDEAVARQMGIAPRTMRRRLSGIMSQLGARTRFQAGMEICRRALF
ncbi:MAG: LuxR C-terminal-related transcriptional regulator [Actinomycetota bacterium]|nr:LuxR C-terminal-related transcriptional regulator [Actinomycetota bacterium]